MEKPSKHQTPNRTKDPDSKRSNGHSGWHRYKLALISATVSENLHHWYVKHVQRFLAEFEGSSLSEISADQLATHFDELNSLQFHKDW